MSQKYHINAMGDAKPCSATTGACPFGGADEHYASAEDARNAYESAMEQHIQTYQKKKAETSRYPKKVTMFGKAAMDERISDETDKDIVVAQVAYVNDIRTTVYEAYKISEYGDEVQVHVSTYLSTADLRADRPTSRPSKIFAGEYTYSNAYEIADLNAEGSINKGIEVHFDENYDDLTALQFSPAAREDDQSLGAYEKARSAGTVDSAIEAGAYYEDGTPRSGPLAFEFNKLKDQLSSKHLTSDLGKNFIESAVLNGSITDNHSARSVNRIAYGYHKETGYVPQRKKTRAEYVSAKVTMANIRGIRQTGEILRSLRESNLSNKQIQAIVSDRSLDELSAKDFYAKIGVKSLGEHVNGEGENIAPYPSSEEY
jgi:hypothetical protein